MIKWPRRKIDSKRRWVARFRVGKTIPITAFEQHPKLWAALGPKEYLPYVDGYRKYQDLR